MHLASARRLRHCTLLAYISRVGAMATSTMRRKGEKYGVLTTHKGLQWPHLLLLIS
jgi:hypothetical protein